MSSFVGGVKVNRITTAEIAGTANTSGGTDPVSVLSAINLGGATVAQGIQATSLTSSGALSVSGGSSLQAVQATDIDSTTLDTTGDVSVGGNFSVAGGLTFIDVNCSNVVASKNISAGETLQVGGATTLSDALSGTSATFSGAVSAQGLTTTTLGASGDITGVNETLTGSMTAQSATINNTLGVSGVSTLGQLDAQTTTATALTVSGASDLQGATTCVGLTASGDVSTTENLSVGKDLTVSGNLVVNGDSTRITSTVKEIADPVLQLGDNTVASVKDAGVSLLWNDGSAKEAFMGLDTSDGKFMVIADATDASEVFSGTLADFKCGNLEATGVSLGGDITASNLTATSNTSLQHYTATDGELSGSITVAGAGVFQDTVSITNGLTGNTASFGTSLTAPLATLDNITSTGTAVSFDKDITATGKAISAQSATLSAGLSAVSATLTGDASAVNMTATTNMTASTGKFDVIDGKSAISTFIGIAKRINGLTASFTGEVEAGSLVSTGDIESAGSVKTDTLDAKTTATIAVAKPLALGTNGLTSTGAGTLGSLTTTGTTKAGTLKAPTLTTDATEISVGKPLNLGTNSLTTTSALNADTGVFTTSVSAPSMDIENLTANAFAVNEIGANDNSDVKFSAPVDFQAHAVSSTGSISADTFVGATSLSTPLLTTTGATINVNKDLALGTKKLTATEANATTLVATTKVVAPLLDSNGTDIKLNKELNIQAHNIVGTGDIKTTGTVECGELKILDAVADTVLVSSTTTDSLVINGAVFVPSDQTINNLKAENVEAIASNINIGNSNGGDYTLLRGGVEVLGQFKVNGANIAEKLTDLDEVALTGVADGECVKWDGSNIYNSDTLGLASLSSNVVYANHIEPETGSDIEFTGLLKSANSIIGSSTITGTILTATQGFYATSGQRVHTDLITDNGAGDITFEANTVHTNVEVAGSLTVGGVAYTAPLATNFTSLADGEVMVYDNANTEWVNSNTLTLTDLEVSDKINVGSTSTNYFLKQDIDHFVVGSHVSGTEHKHFQILTNANGDVAQFKLGDRAGSNLPDQYCRIRVRDYAGGNGGGEFTIYIADYDEPTQYLERIVCDPDGTTIKGDATLTDKVSIGSNSSNCYFLKQDGNYFKVGSHVSGEEHNHFQVLTSADGHETQFLLGDRSATSLPDQYARLKAETYGGNGGQFVVYVADYTADGADTSYEERIRCDPVHTRFSGSTTFTGADSVASFQGVFNLTNVVDTASLSASQLAMDCKNNSYKVEDVDYTASGTISGLVLTNVKDGGNYVFRVKASHASGVSISDTFTVGGGLAGGSAKTSYTGALTLAQNDEAIVCVFVRGTDAYISATVFS